MPSSSLESSAARFETHYRSIRHSGDQEQIIEVVGKCVEAYRALGNTNKESEFLYVLGKSQILRGSYAAALHTADVLVESEKAKENPVFNARALILRSAALRNQTQFEPAVLSARRALEALSGMSESSQTRVEAIQGIIAGLVEAGKIDEAWELREQLASSLELIGDAAFAGRGYWTLGNLAFAHGRIDAGLEYQSKAAELLQKAGDVHVWARFNNARADVQLQVGMADEHTEDCISRAELAYEIIGGSATELTGLAVTRARWHLLKGEPAEASNILEEALACAGRAESLEDPGVHLFWSEILTTLGRDADAERARQNAVRIQADAAG